VFFGITQGEEACDLAREKLTQGFSLFAATPEKSLGREMG